ncbi:MAG: hypothetical protein US60_C0006G0052 [Microgenomates group bacterium GW2011_GWC1_37_8]|uniref:SpoVT-AbrB domain-containing protein n=1 Tax=Candidatus Woesebacteria bacterium GW2011_GWB1_38_8 TaxID=1618570 RepID=A0A0G0NGX9_9BACT|nr:MAG: hypothetical protein US60_C0006G0052 [Microgenomates group bacterium GW2011_GWC1_37_8]KKQ85124.1 MAG: hypothetical protein UT08_C0010G0051 [Candidatus Woesebacteria bacterium GW2011_GWB1_38_8]
MYTVSITSQGQISIPAKIRRELGFHRSSKAIVSIEKGKMVVEPVVDFMSLKGSLHRYVKKGMSLDKIIRMEEKAWEEAAVERYLKSLTPQQKRIVDKYRKNLKKRR